MRISHLLLLPLVLLLLSRCQKDEPDCTVKYTRLVADRPAVKQWFSDYLFGQRLINNTVWFWGDGNAIGIRLNDHSVVKVSAPSGLYLDLGNPDNREYPFVATSDNTLWVLNQEEAVWEKRFETPADQRFTSFIFNGSLGKIPFLTGFMTENQHPVWWHDLSSGQTYEATGLNDWLDENQLIPFGQPIFYTNGVNREALAVSCFYEGLLSVLVLYDFNKPGEADTLHIPFAHDVQMFKVEDRLYVQSSGNIDYSSLLYRIDTDHSKVLWKTEAGRFAAIGPFLFGEEGYFGDISRYDEETGRNAIDHLSWPGGFQRGGGLFHGDFVRIAYSRDPSKLIFNRILLSKTNNYCMVMDADTPGGEILRSILPDEVDSLLIGFGNDGRVHFFKPE